MRSALVPILLADPMPWAFKAPYAWDFLRDRARFAGGYKGALSNTPNWTFTRASTGYAQNAAGVLVPFASGELRRTDKGVLIEGARTNTQTSTNKNPSGTTNISLVDTGTGGSIAVVDDSSELASLGLTGNVLRIIGGTSTTYANFAGGAATDVPHVCSAYIRGGTGLIGYSSGGLLSHAFGASASYVRVVTAATAPGAVGRTMMIGANAGQTLYVTLHQMEAGSFVSSPIVVAGAAATRAADVLTVPVSGIDYPLTLYAEFERASDSGTDTGVFEVNNGTTTDRALLNINSSDLMQVYARTSSVDQVNATIAGALAIGTVYKTAARISTNDSRHALGGTLGTQDTSCTNPATPSKIVFGNQNSGTVPIYGYLRRLAIFSRALSDGELQALTAA